MLKVFIASGFASLCLMACSSTSTQTDSPPLARHWLSRNAASTNSVPSADQLFLIGKFNLKPDLVHSLVGMREDHYGEDMDLSLRRPVYDLKGTVFDSKYGNDQSKLYANFYYHGKFYIARVPKQGVENVYFTLSYFPPTWIAAHSLMRFQMKDDKPVELVAEMPDLTQLQKLAKVPDSERLDLLADELSGPEYRLKNVVISAEAQWTQQDKYKAYDLQRGKEGAFIQIGRFEASEERFVEFYNGGNISKEIQLDPSRGHFDDILSSGLKMSQRDGLSKFYDTGFYNCTSFAFEMIEMGQGFHDPRVDLVAKVVEDRFPILAPEKVKVYGTLPGMIVMHEDPTLKNESLNAYLRDIIKIKRPVCQTSMTEEQCQNINDAIDHVRIFFQNPK